MLQNSVATAITELVFEQFFCCLFYTEATTSVAVEGDSTSRAHTTTSVSSHVTSGTSHVTSGTSHVTSGTSHVTSGTSHVSSGTSHVTSGTSHVTSHVTDKSLRRLLKDLCRCEVSIVKYEAMLKDVSLIIIRTAA